MITRQEIGRQAGQASRLLAVFRSRSCRNSQVPVRWQSTTNQPQTTSDSQQKAGTDKLDEHVKIVQGKSKTQAQLDEELRQKLSAIAGDGGEAGVEYEDGKPVAMKRSVQQNMFRYI